jgi:hypothetical protein
MFGRDEKVSPVRLTAVQYIVLGIFLILAYGLWRLQVMQSDMYASLQPMLTLLRRACISTQKMSKTASDILLQCRNINPSI